MNPLRLFPQRLFLYPTLLILAVMVCDHLSAQTDLYWAPGNNLNADGVWSTSSAVWSENADGTGTLVVWPGDGNAVAHFRDGAGASYAITVEGAVSVDSITFQTGSAGTRTFNQGAGGELTLITGEVNIPGGNTGTFNVPLAGTNGLNRAPGSGGTNLNVANPNLSGDVTLSGTANINDDGVLPADGKLILWAQNTRVNMPNGATRTVAGLEAEGTNPGRRVATSGTGTPGVLILDRNDTETIEFFGRSGNAWQNNGASITKRGTYTQILSGNRDTRFGNAAVLRIEEGTLVLAKVEEIDDPTRIAKAWSPAGSIEVAGGELRFDGPDQLGTVLDGSDNPVPSTDLDFELSGGVMNLNNFRNADEGGDLVQFGTLDLQGNATIDFGSASTSELWFSDSSAVGWDEAALLNIVNFDPGISLLRFGLDDQGLTGTQLDQFQFQGSPQGALIDSQGFIAPIPEPGTAGLLILAAGMLVAGRRRRTRKLRL